MKCAATDCEKTFAVVYESHKPKEELPVIFCYECAGYVGHHLPELIKGQRC